jgi:hypothetical protein
MPRPGKPSLTEFADAQAAAKFKESQELARKNRVLTAELSKLSGEMRDVRRRLELYEEIESTPVKPPVWLVPTKVTKEHTAIPTMLLTDIHWDEVIKAEQIDFINSYDRRIAAMRVKRAFERAIHVSRDYVSGVSYTGFSLALGGDIFSGLIHEELRETNKATIIEGIISVTPLLVAGIRLLAEHFGRVDVEAVVGNHGRNSIKPKAKNRAQDNFDWLVYKLVQRELEGDKRITMRVADAPDAHFQVHGTKYLLTHGDQFRGGSGIASALSPLLIGAHRKTRRQAASRHPYDVMMMGHFHSSIWLPSWGVIVGGSVVGYSEFAYQQNLPPERPQADMWLNTPEHGITIHCPVFLQDRKAEGW